MTGTDTFVVGEELPRIEAVSAHEGFRISVTWASGSRAGQSDVVDLGPDVFSYKVYAPLRDSPDLFRSVRVINYGSAIAWGEGDDLDMSAEGIEELAEQAMSPADFKAFMERNKFTQEAAAAQLGVSRRQVNYFLTSKTIPRTVALACAYIDQRGGTVEAMMKSQEGIERFLMAARSSLPGRMVFLSSGTVGTGSEIAQAVDTLREGLRTRVSTSGTQVFGPAYSCPAVSQAEICDPDYALLDLRSLKANTPVVFKK